MSSKCFAKEVIRCRDDRLQLQRMDSIPDIPLSLPDSLKIQKDIISLLDKKVVGWKLGGTNDASRNATGFYEVLWGPIFDKSVFTSSAVLIDPLLLGAEVEVALKLSEDFNVSDLSNLTLNNCELLFSQVALAIELPCSVVASGVESGGAIVADLCASGYAVISEPVQYCDYNSSNLSFEVYLNNKVVSSGDVNYLCDKMEKLVIDFLKAATSRGFLIESGQWILTGGLSPLIKVKDGDTLLVKSSLFSSICASFS